MKSLEATLYDLSHLFLAPVLVLILLALAYAFLALGGFLLEGLQRRRGRYRSVLAAWQARHGGGRDDLELWIMRRLEWDQLGEREAGLVADTLVRSARAIILDHRSSP